MTMSGGEPRELARQRRSLPVRQPARAAVVLAGYVLAVALVSGLLGLRFSGVLLLLMCVSWGAILLVPLAVLVQRPTPDVEAPVNGVPVLKRPR